MFSFIWPFWASSVFLFLSRLSPRVFGLSPEEMFWKYTLCATNRVEYTQSSITLFRLIASNNPIPTPLLPLDI